MQRVENEDADIVATSVSRVCRASQDLTATTVLNSSIGPSRSNDPWCSPSGFPALAVTLGRDPRQHLSPTRSNKHSMTDPSDVVVNLGPVGNEPRIPGRRVSVL